MNKKIVSKLMILVCLISLLSVNASAQKHGWDKNYGKIKRLYPSTLGINFMLKDGKTSIIPESSYFVLSMDHPNYIALKDLLYKAAENGWTLYVRTEENLENGNAKVVYFVVDF